MFTSDHPFRIFGFFKAPPVRGYVASLAIRCCCRALVLLKSTMWSAYWRRKLIGLLKRLPWFSYYFGRIKKWHIHLQFLFIRFFQSFFNLDRIYSAYFRLKFWKAIVPNLLICTSIYPLLCFFDLLAMGEWFNETHFINTSYLLIRCRC